MRTECVAMLLAGGRGERLSVLTESLAKPAVTFGGKYKIIDFALTNCVRSGIHTVGVLTQYRPLRLNNYIGKGQHWDLDLMSGGVYILPPYSRGGSAAWYSGSANAVYQNQHFIDSFDPEYVLVLSGDQVYKMDYSRLIESHRDKGADATIAVIEVPYEDASRFGIMSTDSFGRITEFIEKPAEPKSNLASMGIYVFNWTLLKEYLFRDEHDSGSENDFGKNIIPAMLDGGQSMYSYLFEGYWRDVGTTESLWQANMDLLEDPALGLDDWHVLSRSAGKPPHYIAATGSIKNCLITEGCEIYGSVQHSVLSDSVIIEEGAVVRDCVLMSGVVVKRGAQVSYAVIDEDSVVEAGARVGMPRESGGELTVIGRRETVSAAGDSLFTELAERSGV